MARSRKYLNNLPNAQKIKDLASDILDCELKLDRVLQENTRVKNEIMALQTQILSLDNDGSSEELENTQIQLNESSKVLILQDIEIADLKRNIHNLQSLVDDEIREGLSQLFHEAKSDLDAAKKDVIKHQKMVEDSQHRLMNSSAEESQETHDEWIQHVNKVIKDEERIKESEKQIEAIKRVYRLEFG
jgi:hypoxanthine phosphoribosyltransferase